MKSIKIAVNQIRQYIFCPRVVYFETVLGISVQKPYWVNYGTEYHKNMITLLKRNNLVRLGFKDGEYTLKTNVSLNTEDYNFYGIADGVLLKEDEVIPVELKMSTANINKSHEMQLIAYGMLAEKIYNKKFIYGIVVYGNRKKINTINAKKTELLSIVSEITHMINLGKIPNSSATLDKCMQCEYLNFCNDRV